MADQEQLERLKRSIEEWNQWRQEQSYDFCPDLSLANLNNINLSHANLSGALLRDASLIGANLSEALLSSANLTGALLGSANLSHANLSEAFLSGVNLYSANLRGASLDGAILKGSDLSEADLTNAFFSYTTFAWVNLSSVKGLETAIYAGPSTIDINSVILPTKEHIRNRFLYGVGFTKTQIESLPSLLTPRPIEYPSLFICYAHQDEAIAKRLYTHLRKEDVPCWFAPYDLRPGIPILRGIEEAIHRQEKFLLILSKHAVNSAWVEREVDAVLYQEIRRRPDILVPIRLDNAVLESSASWAIQLQRRHIGDFTHWQDEAAYQEAFTTLLRHLKVVKPPIT